jgi:DNA-binding MarR family transcriptional regulator
VKNEHTTVLNTLFAETYNNIGRYEETVLKNASKHNLSLNEFNIIECIGKYDGKDDLSSANQKNKNGITISEIAQYMGVSIPTITVAIQKLEAKGYVTRNRTVDDGRFVYVALTRQGQKMNAAHKYFHKHMVRIVGDQFDDNELDILIRCMKTINNAFKTESYSLNEKSETGVRS